MSRLAELKAAASRNDVAQLLHTTLKGLTAVLYAKPIAGRYISFEISKRSGGSRVIKAPDEKLKLLQKKLSDLLQDSLDEIQAAKNQKDNIAHGFKRRCSIVSNAKKHRNRRWVFNLDLQDFFPSINFGRVVDYSSPTRISPCIRMWQQLLPRLLATTMHCRREARVRVSFRT